MRLKNQTAQWLKILFEQSNHPHIKIGEVYVAYFTNVLIDNNVVDAIGVFKSEVQTDFLQFEEKESNLEMILQHGINLNIGLKQLE